jgi:large subunit ribosomal protein L13
MKYTIDAQNKKIGRIASEAAACLMGKRSVSFAKNKVQQETVEIINTDKLDITAKKKSDDVYVTYTGYRGGLKNESLGALMNRRGISEVLKRAIYRMLPNNKLRDQRIKKLTIKG